MKKRLQWGGLFWIIHVDPKCNHRCPIYEREPKGDLTVEVGHVRTEARAWSDTATSLIL